jgi:hypothetical protein
LYFLPDQVLQRKAAEPPQSVCDYDIEGQQQAQKNGQRYPE